jgi:signal peptidase I
MTHPIADVKSGQMQAQPESQPKVQPRIPALNPSPDSIRPHASSPHHHKTGILPALQSLLHLIVIAIFIITFCAQPFRIPS